MAGLTDADMLAGRNQTLFRLQFTYGINFFGMLGTSWLILAYADAADAPGRLLLGLCSLSVALFACLSLTAILKETDALRRDRASGIGKAYDSWMHAVPLSLFSILTVAANLATCAAQLWATFT